MDKRTIKIDIRHCQWEFVKLAQDCVLCGYKPSGSVTSGSGLVQWQAVVSDLVGTYQNVSVRSQDILTTVPVRFL